MNDFKKVILPILGVIVLITVVGLYYRKTQGSPLFETQTPTPAKTLAKSEIIIGNVTLNVERAVTSAEKAKGLSGRDSLDKDGGMLFIMDQTNSLPTFWMKDMKITIDIVWIKNGKIIQIDRTVPPPEIGTPDSKLRRYSPPVPVDAVLEVNSGFCEQNGIKVGDSVQIPPTP